MCGWLWRQVKVGGESAYAQQVQRSVKRGKVWMSHGGMYDVLAHMRRGAHTRAHTCVHI